HSCDPINAKGLRCGNVFLPVPDSTVTDQGLASQCLVLDRLFVSRAVVGIGLGGVATDRLPEENGYSTCPASGCVPSPRDADCHVVGD
ncbi:MAG: hypothetical protein ACON5J_05825, partial [Rubripirellula sp.]